MFTIQNTSLAVEPQDASMDRPAYAGHTWRLLSDEASLEGDDESSIMSSVVAIEEAINLHAANAPCCRVDSGGCVSASGTLNMQRLNPASRAPPARRDPTQHDDRSWILHPEATRSDPPTVQYGLAKKPHQ